MIHMMSIAIVTNYVTYVTSGVIQRGFVEWENHGLINPVYGCLIMFNWEGICSI
jgi:hypothetical protein